VANRHSGGDSVRVNNQIWTDTFLSERHIFLPVGHPNSTFLAVSRCELITDLRDTNRPHLNFGEAVPLRISCQNHRVNHA